MGMCICVSDSHKLQMNLFALYGDCFILLKATIYVTFNQAESSQSIFESENCFSGWCVQQLHSLQSRGTACARAVQQRTTVIRRQFARGFFFFPCM